MLRKFFNKKDECEKDYKIQEELGTGSFAVVKKAVDRTDGSVWAVKIIDKAKLDQEDKDALEVEVAILQKVDHPNIVKLRQIYDCPKYFYMVMEVMSGGELFDRIVEKRKYTEEEARIVVKKITAALEYCHALGIVHRDLKPENLLYATEKDDAEIKIADFGLAKLLTAESIMQTACGTPGYVAPEILTGGSYSDKVDMWSLGVITYILLCGFPPFYDENNTRLFMQIKSGQFSFPSPYWDGVSDEAKDFIRQLIVVDHKKRLSATDVLKHKWVTPDAGKGVGVGRDIGGALTELKKFNNARGKLKKGIEMSRIVARMAMMGKKRADGKGGLAAAAARVAGGGGGGGGGGDAGDA